MSELSEWIRHSFGRTPT